MQEKQHTLGEVLTQYFKKLDSVHYENTRKIIVEAYCFETGCHHVDQVIPAGSKWELIRYNGGGYDLKYETEHGKVLLCPYEPELEDRIIEKDDAVIITLI